MKKYIFTFLFCLIAFLLNSNSIPTQDTIIYDDFGEFYYPTNDDNTFTKFKIYVVRLTLRNSDQKSLKSVYGYKYKYELYVKSMSKLEGNLVSTYIHNIKVFINGFEVSAEQFPDGFWVLVSPKGRAIYWYEGNEEKIKFGLKWGGSIFYKNTQSDGQQQ